MKTIEPYFIGAVIILIFLGGYYAGLSESEAGKHVLKMSQWEQTRSHRVCMSDHPCKMFVAVKK